MAIARDTVTNITTGTSPISFSHTCSGSQRVLLVIVVSDGGDHCTGVTYNSVSMTQLVKKQESHYSGFVYLYGLFNPASGSNTVSITLSVGSGYGGSVSYTGCRGYGFPDATDSDTSNSKAIVTTQDNCVVVMAGVSDSTNTNTTNMNKLSWNNGVILGESATFPITPAGSYTMDFNISGGTSGQQAITLVSLAPSLTFTLLDTITMSEHYITTYLINVLETITMSEPYLFLKKAWKTLIRSISNWTDINES
jgi:hypothetical protein